MDGAATWDQTAAWSARPQSRSRQDIRRIEQLSDAVLGAGLETIQFTPNLGGSLLHARRRGALFSSGFIDGKVALRGCLSREVLTLGLGLNMVGSARQWLSPVGTGTVVVFGAGEPHDGMYDVGSVYLAVSLPFEMLAAEAEREGVLLPGGLATGVLERSMAQAPLARLSAAYSALLTDAPPPLPPGETVEEVALAALVEHLSGGAEIVHAAYGASSYERIVDRARAFIDGAIETPLSTDQIARAAHTSRRSLNRAFLQVLGETPREYVLKLRLQRIRDDLASPREAELTVTMASNRWGVAELGRLAARYRELFGELPSETLRRRRTGVTLAQTAYPDRHAPATLDEGR